MGGDGLAHLVGSPAWWSGAVPRRSCSRTSRGLDREGGQGVFESPSPSIETGYRVRLRKIDAADYGLRSTENECSPSDPPFSAPTRVACGAPGQTGSERCRRRPRPSARRSPIFQRPRGRRGANPRITATSRRRGRVLRGPERSAALPLHRQGRRRLGEDRARTDAARGGPGAQSLIQTITPSEFVANVAKSDKLLACPKRSCESPH